MSYILPEGVKCVAINPQHPETLKLFDLFYHDVYVKAFPNKDECESYENLLSYIEGYRTNELFVRVFVFHNDIDIVGGIIIDYFDVIETLAIEFIVVSSKYQRQGLAKKIIEYIKEYLKSQYQKSVEWIIIEIENPKFVTSKNFSYLHFWINYGMRAIDFTYIQPALSPSQKPVDILMLCACHTSHDIKSVSKDHIKNFLTLYAHHAMGIDEPLQDPSVQQMFDELEGIDKESLGLVDLTTLLNQIEIGDEV